VVEVESADTSLRNTLRSLGFPDDLTDEPVLPECRSTEHVPRGGQPPRYQSLFWRRLAARQPFGMLTIERLEEHNAQHAATFHSFANGKTTSEGEQLTYFKYVARAAPVQDVSVRLFGPDIGLYVAAFIGTDAMGSSSDAHGTTVESADSPDFQRVVGSQYTHLPAASSHRGCTGFIVEDDFSTSMPDFW